MTKEEAMHEYIVPSIQRTFNPKVCQQIIQAISTDEEGYANISVPVETKVEFDRFCTVTDMSATDALRYMLDTAYTHIARKNQASDADEEFTIELPNRKAL